MASRRKRMLVVTYRVHEVHEVVEAETVEEALAKQQDRQILKSLGQGLKTVVHSVQSARGKVLWAADEFLREE